MVYCPAGQEVVQLLAPTPENIPKAQLKQAALPPAAAKVFAAQLVQLVAEPPE